MPGRIYKASVRAVSEAPERLIFGFYLLGSLLIRLPFFFRDYIDRDESTFILVAQSMVDGHLPYTELWDLKPPLLFLWFALPISVFGKSMLAIRLMGTLAVSGVAFYTFKGGQELSGRISGFAAGLCCMFLMSLFNSVQGVMSEHLSMLFFVPAIYLLLRPPASRRFFLAGVALAVATLCKSNLAIPVVLLGAVLCWTHGVKGGVQARRALLFFGLGGFATLFLSFLPYVLNSHGQTWWDSVIRAPLAYSDSEASSPLRNWPFYAITVLLLWRGWYAGWLDRSKPGNQIVLVGLAGVLLAFFLGGKLNGHYLLQFYPLFLIWLFEVFRQKLPAIPRWVSGGSLLLLLVLPVESYLEYGNIVENYKAKGRWINGEGVDVPLYLNAHYPGTQRVLFLEYHIGYWFMGISPPSAASTHPSNLCREFLYPFMPDTRSDSEAELRYLMESYRPEFVICRQRKPIFNRRFLLQNSLLQSYLLTGYVKDTVLGKAVVYKKL